MTEFIIHTGSIFLCPTFCRPDVPLCQGDPCSRGCCQGDELGEVRVYDRGVLLARSPLVASRSISGPGGLDRAGWYIGQTVRNMWGWVS